MALKSYEELRKIDVTPYCDERDKIRYLNWAKCVDLLHENGAEIVYFEPATEGSSLLMTDAVFTDSNGNTNRCYETKIKVFIDKKEYLMQGPVTNGANPVKDNSMSQQRVWNCQCRLFVKCVAIHTGLGFDLWLKEEKTDFNNQKVEIKHEILQVRERVFEKVTELQKKNNLSLDDIAAKLNMERDEVEMYLKQYVILARFEKSLFEI